MITFQKLTNVSALILFNGERVGVLEKTIGGYVVELEYVQHFVPDKVKSRLRTHIETVYKFKHNYITLKDILNDCRN